MISPHSKCLTLNKSLHDFMSKPLSLPGNADNPVVRMRSRTSISFSRCS